MIEPTMDQAQAAWDEYTRILIDLCEQHIRATDGVDYGLFGPATAEEMTPSEVKW